MAAPALRELPLQAQPGHVARQVGVLLRCRADSLRRAEDGLPAWLRIACWGSAALLLICQWVRRRLLGGTRWRRPLACSRHGTGWTQNRCQGRCAKAAGGSPACRLKGRLHSGTGQSCRRCCCCADDTEPAVWTHVPGTCQLGGVDAGVQDPDVVCPRAQVPPALAAAQAAQGRQLLQPLPAPVQGRGEHQRSPTRAGPGAHAHLSATCREAYTDSSSPPGPTKSQPQKSASRAPCTAAAELLPALARSSSSDSGGSLQHTGWAHTRQAWLGTCCSSPHPHSAGSASSSTS